MRGTAWRFVEFKEDHILVEPVREIGDVPSWVGEDIPVPFDVAQEVGRIRRERDLSAYPVNEHGASTFLAYLASVGDAPLATDTRITIESARDVLIVNACFGSKVNETLAQLISSLISARFGQSVGVQTDPYRIVLEVPRSVNPQQVIEILRPEDPDALEPLLRVILKNASFLRWALVHVGKQFGAPPREVARMVAVNAPYGKEKNAKLDFEGKDKESRSKAKRLFTNASLVMAHGRKAVLALMARGVGEDTAARILRGYHETEQDFLRDVLAAEITYARTKRFWD